jgi:hypothetical protein
MQLVSGAGGGVWGEFLWIQTLPGGQRGHTAMGIVLGRATKAVAEQRPLLIGAPVIADEARLLPIPAPAPRGVQRPAVLQQYPDVLLWSVLQRCAAVRPAVLQPRLPLRQRRLLPQQPELRRRVLRGWDGVRAEYMVRSRAEVTRLATPAAFQKKRPHG